MSINGLDIPHTTKHPSLLCCHLSPGLAAFGCCPAWIRTLVPLPSGSFCAPWFVYLLDGNGRNSPPRCSKPGITLLHYLGVLPSCKQLNKIRCFNNHKKWLIELHKKNQLHTQMVRHLASPTTDTACYAIVELVLGGKLGLQSTTVSTLWHSLARETNTCLRNQFARMEKLFIISGIEIPCSTYSLKQGMTCMHAGRSSSERILQFSYRPTATKFKSKRQLHPLLPHVA